MIEHLALKIVSLWVVGAFILFAVSFVSMGLYYVYRAVRAIVGSESRR